MKKRIGLCFAAIVLTGCAGVDSRNTSARPWNQPPVRTAIINWWPYESGWWSWDIFSRYEQEQWFNSYGR